MNDRSFLLDVHFTLGRFWNVLRNTAKIPCCAHLRIHGTSSTAVRCFKGHATRKALSQGHLSTIEIDLSDYESIMYGNLKTFEVKHYGLGHGRWCSGALKEQDASDAHDVLPSAELVEQCSKPRLVDD